MRGEWIEIAYVPEGFGTGDGLSPCGESGLKSLHHIIVCKVIMSLPMRGEWIEIAKTLLYVACFESLPMRGEWIEIPSGKVS